jgi:blue copper oxidase
MSINRRSLVMGAGAACLGGVLGANMRSARADTVLARNPLAIPALENGRAEMGQTIFDLSLQSGSRQFLPGRTTPTLGINGDYLGPTMRCRAGQNVTMRVTNTLGFASTLHWHGMHVPASADGGPHQVISPNAVWSPSFQIRQKAGLFWYHSHLMHRTGAQVNAGLAGLILVEDEESAALDLPHDYGVDDIPLVIQDRRFRDDGGFDYLTAMPDMMMGFKGDVILVNGTVSPQLTLRRQRTRLRLLNGSNSRIYNIARSDGRSVVQIATGGSLLERAVERRSVRLGPGERADILIDAMPDTSLDLISLPDDPGGRGPGMIGMMGRAGNDERFTVLTLQAGKLETSKTQLPGRLIEVPSWDATKAQRTRRFVLGMGMMGGMGMGGGMGRMGGGMMGMTINGRSMDMERIDERVPLGATEIWSISNATPLSHPFHIHDIQFRVLDRDGVPALPHERGLKDTVMVDPGETVRVITRFEDFADPNHPYMYHCHILEHEDAGMMGQFVVV